MAIAINESNVLSERSESKDSMFYVYILRTSSDTFYIGQTDNLLRRLQEHKDRKNKSAKYLRYFQSFQLAYKEKLSTRLDAMHREIQLKKWPRAKKEALIRRDLISLKKLWSPTGGARGSSCLAKPD